MCVATNKNHVGKLPRNPGIRFAMAVYGGMLGWCVYHVCVLWSKVLCVADGRTLPHCMACRQQTRTHSHMRTCLCTTSALPHYHHTLGVPGLILFTCHITVTCIQPTPMQAFTHCMLMCQVSLVPPMTGCYCCCCPLGTCS